MPWTGFLGRGWAEAEVQGLGVPPPLGVGARGCGRVWALSPSQGRQLGKVQFRPVHACGAALRKRPDEHLSKVVQGPQCILARSVGPHLGVGRQLHSGGAALHTLGTDATQILAALAQPQGASYRKGSHLSSNAASLSHLPTVHCTALKTGHSLCLNTHHYLTGYSRTEATHALPVQEGSLLRQCPHHIVPRRDLGQRVQISIGPDDPGCVITQGHKHSLGQSLIPVPLSLDGHFATSKSTTPDKLFRDRQAEDAIARSRVAHPALCKLTRIEARVQRLNTHGPAPSSCPVTPQQCPSLGSIGKQLTKKRGEDESQVQQQQFDQLFKSSAARAGHGGAHLQPATQGQRQADLYTQDMVERGVDDLPLVISGEQLHPIGAPSQSCNAGFVNTSDIKSPKLWVTTEHKERRGLNRDRGLLNTDPCVPTAWTHSYKQHRLLIGLLKPDRLCAKQQRSNTTFNSRGGPKRVALDANQLEHQWRNSSMAGTYSDAKENKTYFKVVLLHLVEVPTVQVEHADAAAHRNVVPVGIQSCEVDQNRAKAPLDLCGNGIEEIWTPKPAAWRWWANGRVPAEGWRDRTERNVNLQPGAWSPPREGCRVGQERRSKGSWGAAAAPGSARTLRRPVPGTDAGCDRRAARGGCQRDGDATAETRRAETGRGGSARRRNGAGPTSGTSAVSRTRQRAPGLTSRSSPSGLVNPASPEEAGCTPGRRGCREPVAWATGWASESSSDSSESLSDRATSVGRPVKRK
ncbi:hypothetical protein U0070_017460 [Myodes glareolus]|uniref:Uncharacterized protein n=1 Tax=Myodes glareolus TaxID=447135 RepID=A0AAW0HL08_MYOGA